MAKIAKYQGDIIMAGKKTASGNYSMWIKPIWSTVIKTNKNYKSNYQGAMLYAHYELT